jgi:hypothetical protein
MNWKHFENQSNMQINNYKYTNMPTITFLSYWKKKMYRGKKTTQSSSPFLKIFRISVFSKLYFNWISIAYKIHVTEQNTVEELEQQMSEYVSVI